MKKIMPRLVGAAIGGALGATVFWLGTRQGFLLPAVPGALLGIGCGFLAKKRSYLWGGITAVLCVAFNLVVEWHFAHDDSFVYYLTHLQDLAWRSQASHVAVAVVGFYFGMGRLKEEKKG